MLQPVSIRKQLSRRGVALMIAISVLAILTIITFALAASVGFASQTGKQSAQRHALQSASWFGLDTAKTLLSKSPDELIGKTRTLTLENGVCELSGTATKAEAAYYAYGTFKLRPGDVEVSTQVTLHPGQSDTQTRTYRYLVNVAPGTERVVVLPPQTTPPSDISQ
jgi:hypothetical protein